MQVRIEVDERETALYNQLFQIHGKENNQEIVLIKKVLPLGDVLIYLILNSDLETVDVKPVVVIERKTFQDLFSSIKDGRYQEQSYRLINTNLVSNIHNIIYLIEGVASQLRSPRDQSLLYSTVTSLNLYKGFSVYRTTHIQESADYIYTMATKILRNAIQRKEFPLYMFLRPLQFVTNNTTETKDQDQDQHQEPPPPNALSIPAYSSVVKIDKKDNITPQNIGVIILCQIPGIQHVTAEQIMKKYHTIRNLIESLSQDPTCMDQFYMTTTAGSQRKLSQSIVLNLKKFLVDYMPTTNV